MRKIALALFVLVGLTTSSWAACDLTTFYPIIDGNKVLRNVVAIILGGCYILPKSAWVDQNGNPYNSLNPPPIPVGAATNGVPGTGLNPPAGGSGILGYLSAIANRAAAPAPIYATPTDRSGTITLGGTAQSLAASNATRKRFTLQNDCSASESVFISDVGTATAVSGGSSFEIQPCGTFDTGAGPISDTAALSIIAATTGHKFTAREFQ